jgi:ferredoxin
MKRLTMRGGPRISVDNDRCERYGICQMEAPRIFELDLDGRLKYRRQPGAQDIDQALQAARCCPVQAIAVKGLADE